MADFPALTPASREYVLSQYPVAEERSFGGSIRFRHGSDGYGFGLRLRFTALTQANAKLIRDHYRVQQGGYLSFSLPDAVWLGHSDIAGVTPASSRWVYSAPVTEEHLQEGRIDVTVALISVPNRYGGAADGLTKTVTITRTGGAATVS